MNRFGQTAWDTDSSRRKLHCRISPGTTSHHFLCSWLANLAFYAAFTVAAAFFFVQQSVASEPNWVAKNLPTKPSDIDGFTCKVEVQNAVSEGYMPLRVTAVSSVGTFPGDRLIRMQIRPTFGNEPTPRTEYLTSFVLPAGKSAVTETFYIPKYFQGGMFNVRLSDTSGALKSYSVNFIINIAPNLRSPEDLITISDWLTRIAVITPEPSMMNREPWALVQDLRSIDSMIEVDKDFLIRPVRQTNAEALNYLQSTSRATHQFMTADKAHENWLGYESVDVILIAAPVLESMKSKYPARYTAIREWVSCGGLLWTYAIGDENKLAGLFDVEVVNGYEALMSRSSQGIDPIDRALNNYTPSQRSTPLQVVLDPYNYTSGIYSSGATVDDPLNVFNNPSDPDHPFTSKKLPQEYKDDIRILPVEAGLVIGLKQEDPFPGSLQQWFVVKHLSGAKQHWLYKRGISVTRGTTGYWDWLMNDVARPPVYTFLGLLSVFVLLVGPVSYYFTRRAGRTYLMFVIAPVLACTTTLLLFGYGFIADGIGTKARIRKITWVNGVSGKASESNRSTYFAAFRPGTGLRFRSDSAVYPVENIDDAIEQDYSGTIRLDRSIDITDTEQVFRGEFLPSRTQSQFISVHPVRGSTGLKIDARDNRWTVTNNFETTLESVILRMPDDSYWTLNESLASGQSMTLSAMPTEIATTSMRELYRKHQPQTPLGYIAPNRSNYRWYQYSNAQSILSRMRYFNIENGDEFGVYESRLRRMLFDETKLPAQWFIATLELQQTASAVEDAVINESVHYAMGTLDLSAVKGVTISDPSAMPDQEEVSDEAAGDENEEAQQ